MKNNLNKFIEIGINAFCDCGKFHVFGILPEDKELNVEEEAIIIMDSENLQDCINYLNSISNKNFTKIPRLIKK